MSNLIAEIYDKIDKKNRIHAKKLRKNLAGYDNNYFLEADAFIAKYNKFLDGNGKTIDYAIDCYLKMIRDMIDETVDFMYTGKYSSTTFVEVNQRVYANPEVMEYFMHGLLMSQFLWKHHYQIFEYFVNT